MIREATRIQEERTPYKPRIGKSEKTETKQVKQTIEMPLPVTRSSILTDWMIKTILGNPEDTEALISFLLRWKYCPIYSLTLNPQEARIDHADQKAIRYDIHGIINDEIYFVIEPQR